MIHITITITDRPLTFILHKFETKVTSPREQNAARVVRTFLPPWLRKVAQGFNARYREIQ